MKLAYGSGSHWLIMVYNSTAWVCDGPPTPTTPTVEASACHIYRPEHPIPQFFNEEVGLLPERVGQVQITGNRKLLSFKLSKNNPSNTP